MPAHMDDDELTPDAGAPADAAPAESETPDEAPDAPEGDVTPDVQAAGIEFARASLALGSRRPYGHVARLFYERPWAVHQATLQQMEAVLRRRMAGGRLSSEEIDTILASARADDGDRSDASYYVAGSVAVISMYGVLAQRASMFADTSTSGTSLDELRLGFREALADPAVRAVVFDIHSPGGSVDGVTEFAAELRSARGGVKPIVAQVNTLAASAAYWIASQADEIVSTPSGEVGSIGVFAVHEDYSAHDEKLGVKTTLIASGKFKVEGNQYEPLTDEAHAAIADQVDTFYQSFLADVAKGRNVSVSAIAEGYGEGRTMLAQKAHAAGMVDRIDTLEATVRRLQPRGAAARMPATARSSLASSETVIPLQTAAPAASIGRPDRAWNRRMKGKKR